MAHRDKALASLLHGQGHGTRKDCARLVREGRVQVAHAAGQASGQSHDPAGLAWRTVADPSEEIAPEGLHLQVDGVALPWRDVLYLALHKPAGFECSHSPSHHQSVFDLVPAPFVKRGLQAVGRLDADTTGLLLLSDSGGFIHHFTSPKRHVPKTYRVEAKHPITPEQVARIAAGVDLRNDEEPTLPATVTLRGERSAEVVIQEGRYHQVKRMFAAVGNRVEGIHRLAIAGLVLEEGLKAGAWRLLTDEDLQHLGYRAP